MNGASELPPWKRAQVIDRAVRELSLAGGVAQGLIEVLRMVEKRCEALGVHDASLTEVIRSWAAAFCVDRNDTFRTSTGEGAPSRPKGIRFPPPSEEHLIIDMGIWGSRYWRDLWRRVFKGRRDRKTGE